MDFRDLWESVPYPAFVLNVKNEIKLANPLSQQYCETSLNRLVGQKLSSYIGTNSAVFEVLDKISSDSSAIVKFDVPINWKNKGNQVFDMYAVSVETGLSNLIFFHPKRLKGKMEQALLNQNSRRIFESDNQSQSYLMYRRVLYRQSPYHLYQKILE